MLDHLQELLLSLQHNKLRTLLTGASVAWGIFMLVLLLSTGRGLQNAVEHNFEDNATNSIWVQPRTTSLPHGPHNPGRALHFDNGDITALVQTLPKIERISGLYFRGNRYVSFQGERSVFDVRACHPDHRQLDNASILSGRFINWRDIDERRKVAVIGPAVVDALFNGSSPLGQMIRVGPSLFEVVGVYEDKGGPGQLRKVYIPISTAQLLFSDPEKVHEIMFTVNATSVAESEAMARSTRSLLARRQQFAADDVGAISLQNNLERFLKIMQIFDWVRVFVWIVGCGTVLAGIVGVSNIILISVKERTREIGIRKALGATPMSIVKSVVGEALLITSVAGYVGLVASVGAVELVRRNLPENEYLRNPDIDLGVALTAVGLLSLAGMLAGLVPALRAARVSPVVAMREE